PENGYEFDLSESVFRGRSLVGADDPVPLVTLVESLRPEPGRAAGHLDEIRRDVWPLIVQGWVDDDTDHPTDPAYQLMAAVEKRLWEVAEQNERGLAVHPDIYLLGDRLIANLSFGPGVVVPPRDGA